jgi:hypothetical protein
LCGYSRPCRLQLRVSDFYWTANFLTCVDREEVTKEDNYEVSGDVDEDEEEWNPVQDWENENDDAEDVQDESTAYLEFLNEEVRVTSQCSTC